VVIDGNQIAWRGFDGNDFEVFLYDGLTISQITDNDVDEVSLQMSGGNLSWATEIVVVAPVPEPSSYVLALVGLLAIGLYSRRRKRA